MIDFLPTSLHQSIYKDTSPPFSVVLLENDTVGHRGVKGVSQIPLMTEMVMEEKLMARSDDW